MSEEKLLLTIEEAADQLSIGRSLMYEQVLSGALRSVRIGRLRRIANSDLEAFVEQLRGSEAQEPRLAVDRGWRSSERSEEFLNPA